MRHKTIHERQRAHEEHARARQEQEQLARAVYSDQILREYEEAYDACHGVKISLKYQHGWVTSKALSSPYRLRELQGMTQNLWARVHERELEE